MTKTSQPLPSVAQGQAGVFRVLSELILRGHTPFVPSSDDHGVDILLRSGVRLQVKSTMRASTHWRLVEGTFLFTLSKGARIAKKAVVPAKAHVFSEECDFIVLWAIEPNRFWIVPAVVLDGRHTVTITPTTQWRDFDAATVETLKAEGLTVNQIAAKLGVARKTVTRRLTTFQSPKRTYTNLNQYENRWDLITESVAALTEATQIVSKPVPDSPVLQDQETVKEP